MIYLLTTCILDITYGVIDWSARKFFSYIYRSSSAQHVLGYSDILEIQKELLDKQTQLVENYQQIIEQQQEKIDALLNYNE